MVFLDARRISWRGGFPESGHGPLPAKQQGPRLAQDEHEDVWPEERVVRVVRDGVVRLVLVDDALRELGLVSPRVDAAPL